MWCSKSRVAWWAVLLAIGQLCCDTATAFSTDTPCLTEIAICAANDECNECLDYLQGLTDLSYNGQCQDLYAEACSVVDQGGCNTANPQLLDLAQCVASEEFGCDGFTTCEESVAATPSPLPAGVTPAPDVSIAPTVLTATLAPTVEGTTTAPAASAPPTPASDRGIATPSASPTGAPSAAPGEADETGSASNGAGGRFGGVSASALAASAAIALACVSVDML